MRTAAWTCDVFVLILGFCICARNHNLNPRQVCWKAILQCHSEPDCLYAYEQYAHACALVLSGERRRCPSHCVSSLIQLNLTLSGPALEDCDCALDPQCARTKRAIEPCVPRTRARMGCTDARRRCEEEPACGAATRDYLFHCRRLFGGGRRCSAECRAVIARMRDIPAARRLETCVCDGAERNICEYIKISMNTFCNEEFDGSGFSDTEEDDAENDEEDHHQLRVGTSGASARFQNALVNLLLLTVVVFL
ncbi:growth arrest-specific protein 1-like [Corythoichthys intestinalis]|uniref:growth arrest-specific protein 1-like n=1 Tax=Corythoichthys intestinalis TaxID=161448 RepID=UPI0025A53E07|nr:growth arrest-specific protein 1-like [Corythoichthys intestinalis]XP_061800547.1 growth arrest-specific protein 1-like [Nerophis lumbriciformis]